MSVALSAKSGQSGKRGDPSIKKVSDPSVKQMSDPSVKKTSDPSVKKMSDPSVKKTSDPSVKNASDPSVKKMSDHSANKVSDTSIKKMSDHNSARSGNTGKTATNSFTGTGGSSSSRTDPLSVSSYSSDPRSQTIRNSIKNGEIDVASVPSPTASDQYDISKLSEAYSALRSVKELDVGGYCDPNDPCCMKPDPERLLNKSLLRAQSRKLCAPKNPFHFEYNILHRLRLKQKLKAMADIQFSGLITGVGAKSPAEHAVSLALSARSILSKGSKYTQSRKASKSKVRMADNEEDEDGSSVFLQKSTIIKPEDLQEFLNGIGFGSMALAHEIALNKDFKFCKPNRPITKTAQIALEAKDKYWQKVDQILIKKGTKDNEKEKELKSVIIDVVCVLKKMLLATILPNNPKMRMRIEKNLSIREISKQIDADTFDFRNLMAFVLDTLSVLCCPVRDQEIIEIRDMVMDEVPFSRQIKKVLDLMEDMNLDMANFIIRQSRPLIIQNCVTFEREQFALYIEQRYQNGVDPIPVTRDWITRNRGPSDSPFSEVMASAFLEILMSDSDEANANPPETLVLDWPRFPKIRQEVQRVILIGAMISSVFDYITSLDANAPEEGTSTFGKFRLVNRLREELNPLVKSEDMSCPAKLQTALDNCSNLAVQVADHYLSSEMCENLQSSQKEDISRLFKSLADKNHSERSLYCQRIRDWFIQVAKKEGTEQLKSPADLQIIAPLILDPMTDMIRLVLYNRSVFDVIYKEIYLGNCPTPKFNQNKKSQKSIKSVKSVKSSKRTMETAGEADEEEERQVNRESLLAPGYGPPPIKDEGLEKLVQKMKDFNERTMTYRRSRIDPQIQPMYNPDGSLIVPPEQQQLVKTEMTPLQQKHYEEYLLSAEPTIEVDYEGLYDDNVMANDPNWLLDQTSEQLLRLMERENIIKANKLKRIKKRMEKDMVNLRIANDFPVFEKIWREELGSLQKEFCRLQRIEKKGNALPDNAQDEPRPKRVFKGACEVVKEEGEKEPPKFNEKGERIIYSRNRGKHFSELSVKAGGSGTGMEEDEPDFSQFAPDYGDEDETVDNRR